jgi:hypothetical protein
MLFIPTKHCTKVVHINSLVFMLFHSINEKTKTPVDIRDTAVLRNGPLGLFDSRSQLFLFTAWPTAS